jgi:hypothetical protein
MKYLITPILFSMSLHSCKQEKNDTTSFAENIVEIPEDFIAFYEQFHIDSVYQLEHIVFPLAQKTDDSKWQKDTWQMHKPFDSQDGNFERVFDNFAGIMTETIMEKNGAFLITRRFSKIGDEYQLIYYSLENRLEGWINKEE